MELADRWRPWVRAGFWLVAFLVACVVFIAVQSQPLFVSVLGIFAVLEAARRLHETIRRGLLDDGIWDLWRVLWLLLMPLAGLLLVGVWWAGRRDGWGFFGVALLYLGLGVIVVEVRRNVALSRVWGLAVTGACAVAAVVGVAVMRVFGPGWSWFVVAAAIVVLPLGLGLLSEVGIDLLPRFGPRVHWAVPAVGLLLFAGGMWLVAKDVNDVYAYFVGGILFVLMLAITARSSADALLVVAMTGLVWALSYRTAPVPESLVAADDKETIVALGDSYISGEGADEFYEGTNAKGDNECRRAPTAYPVSLLAEEQDAIPPNARLSFLACSGATTDGVREQLAEFRGLRRDVDVDVSFVLLSVGGNDAGFGTVARTCLLPGNCAELGPAWSANLANLREALDDVYEEVDYTFPNVPVLVIPYPVPISETYCSSSGFTSAEHVFLHDFAMELNGVVEQAAADARFHYVDTMPGSLRLAGARLCDKEDADVEGEVEVGVNFLAANSVVGTMEQAGNPLNWFHNSLHPNEHGHGLMREAVVGWLDENGAPAVRAEPATEVDTFAVTATGEGPCVDSDESLEACTSRWMTKETGRILVGEGWIAVILALGAWLVALPLTRFARGLFAEL